MLAEHIRWARSWRRAGYAAAPLADVTGRWPTVRYEFACPAGWSMANLEAAAEQVGLAARATWWELSPTVDGRWRLLLDALDWSASTPPSHGPLDGVLSVPIGVHPDEPAVWDLRAAPHLLVSGATGSGKSSVLRAAIASLPLGWCWKVVVIDPKELDFAPARGDFAVHALPDAPDALRGLATSLQERKSRLAAAGVSHWTELAGRIVPTRPVLLVVDEGADVFAGTGLSKAGASEVRDALSVLIRQGRACGFHVVVAITRPDTDSIPGALRDQLGARIALGAMSLDGARMMFGPMTNHLPVGSTPGTGLSLGLDGSRRLRRIRVPWVTLDDARRRHGLPSSS